MKFNVDFDQTKQAVNGRGNSAFELLYSAGWVIMFIFNISGIVAVCLCALLFFFLPFDWSNGLAWFGLLCIWLAVTAVIGLLVFAAFMMSFKLAKEAAQVSQPRDRLGRFASIDYRQAPKVTTNGKFAGYMVDGRLVPPENIKIDE